MVVGELPHNEYSDAGLHRVHQVCPGGNGYPLLEWLSFLTEKTPDYIG